MVSYFNLAAYFPPFPGKPFFNIFVLSTKLWMNQEQCLADWYVTEQFSEVSSGSKNGRNFVKQPNPYI